MSIILYPDKARSICVNLAYMHTIVPELLSPPAPISGGGSALNAPSAARQLEIYVSTHRLSLLLLARAHVCGEAAMH